MTEDTQFEQKLAAYTPRLLREIKVAADLRAAESCVVLRHRDVGGYLNTIRPQMTACVCCFLLGAVTMFVVMTCCFDRVPMGHRQTVHRRIVANKPPQTYTVPLRMQDLDDIRTPADLMTQIRRQPVVVKEEVRSRELGVRSYFYSDLNL